MRDKYIDLVDQTFDFPQADFTLERDELQFCGLPLMDLVARYGTPLRFTYLPKIAGQVAKANTAFGAAMQATGYQGRYYYSYCTKSAHFAHIVRAALKAGTHLELSSAYDVAIVQSLVASGLVKRDRWILCNGFKTREYVEGIAGLINAGFSNVVPIIDGAHELDMLEALVNGPCEVGIRIASEESPRFEFYTSRLGMGYKDILPFYKERLAQHPKFRLKLLHFFVNTGISDTAYYWNELRKSVQVYCQLAAVCPNLNSLDIGGGFPIQNSLQFRYDYNYMAHQIVEQVGMACTEAGIAHPDIFTEFGTFTVGESSGIIYSVLDQKQQNDREKWNIIDSSFMTTLPDSWAVNKRFIMLPINNWRERYERVFLGGITCDSDDYYNAEQHSNAIYLPEFKRGRPQYIGFFYTGAYQESIGGMGGIHHCLMPDPRHIIIDTAADGSLDVQEFRPKQAASDVLRLLGYPTVEVPQSAPPLVMT